VVLLEGWKKFEEENGDDEDVERVQARMPQVTKRWRKLESGDMEECAWLILLSDCVLTTVADWDILFADDEREANPATFKFIQNALAWRNQDGGARKSMLDELLQEEDSDEEKSSGDEHHANDSDEEKSSDGMQD